MLSARSNNELFDSSMHNKTHRSHNAMFTDGRIIFSKRDARERSQRLLGGLLTFKIPHFCENPKGKQNTNQLEYGVWAGLSERNDAVNK